MPRRRVPPALLALALAACGGTAAPEPPAPMGAGPGTGHVHAIGVDPADDTIVIAAHTGLFRAGPGADRAEPTGDARDAMGFTVEGPGRYVASGHPAPGSTDEPASVGLIRSVDAGATWTPVALAGEADLHVLEVAPGGRVYGFDARSGAFRASRDGGRTWRDTAVPPLLDLAVSPRDPDTLVAATQEGLLRSADGGRGWRPGASLPPGPVVWTADGIVVLGLDGQVRRLAAPSEPPETIGALPGPVAAATADGDRLLAAQDDGAVLASDDGGRTWAPVLGPATG